jgi:hypothetical protein
MVRDHGNGRRKDPIYYEGVELLPREKRVKIWTTISQDDYLKLEILQKRTLFPIHYHIKQAIKEYVKDVHPTPSDTT